MTLSEIKDILSQHGIRLTKSLGQSFLHDRNQLQKIVAAAELTSGDKVLEIGPGLGPLTEELLCRAGEVLAIEKDERLLKVLAERLVGKTGRLSSPVGQASSLSSPLGEASRLPHRAGQAAGPSYDLGQAGRLSYVHADALEYLRSEPRDWRGWKMVSNLPYSVASPILVELAQNPAGPERMVVTLQIEVARRLIARAGDPEYGVLTLLVQSHYRPAGTFKIPASCFFPQPDVDSACVSLLRRPQPLLAPKLREPFVHLVKQAFSQRRKMMLKLLKMRWPNAALDDAFAQNGLSPQIRAESVSLEQFIRLAETLAANSPDG